MTLHRYKMFLTERQKEILAAQTSRAKYQTTPGERLGIHGDTIHSTNTYIFNNFLEALEVMTDPENLDTFKGRFKKHEETVWEKTRLLRALLKRVTE